MHEQKFGYEWIISCNNDSQDKTTILSLLISIQMIVIIDLMNKFTIFPFVYTKQCPQCILIDAFIQFIIFSVQYSLFRASVGIKSPLYVLHLKKWSFIHLNLLHPVRVSHAIHKNCYQFKLKPFKNISR